MLPDYEQQPRNIMTTLTARPVLSIVLSVFVAQGLHQLAAAGMDADAVDALGSESELNCPCSNAAHCTTISGPPVRATGEVFGFINKEVNATQLNWTRITTVAWANTPEIVCAAHAHGARAVMASPSLNLVDLADKDERKKWIAAALAKVQASFYDGIVFDYESPQASGSPEADTYALVISETRQEFHRINPSYQISTCVAWSPDDIDGRAYPYVDLAAASDLLYVMDYDTRSQIFDQCVAAANAPYPGMIKGIQGYLNLGISPKKLVLGVPWYGYAYHCVNGTSKDARFCPLPLVPFRGVNCSDAAGHEHDGSTILSILRSPKATTQLLWDENMGAPYFNALDSDTGGVVQYWFDNARSLIPKYLWAKEHGLAGVGPYCFSMYPLDNHVMREDAQSMWSALDAFF